MRYLIKLLLSLSFLVAGFYAATPLWLPYVVAGQLPPGWQLDRLNTGYWGFSGIDINEIRVTGGIQSAVIELTASDTRLTYRGLKVEVGLLDTDVRFLAVEDRVAEALTLHDLSFPVTEFAGGIPELSVMKLRTALHHEMDMIVTNPLVLNFQALEITPGADDEFHLTTNASLDSDPGVNVYVIVDKTSSSLKTSLHFAMDENSPPWVSIALEQSGQASGTVTQVQVAFDAAAADQDWLDMVLAQSTSDRLTHASGTLQAKAQFEGTETQEIKQVSLAAEGLRLEFSSGWLNLNAVLLADREGEKVTVTLPKAAEIQFYDTGGQVQELISMFLPELQLTSWLETTVLAGFEPASSLVLQTGEPRMMAFNGDARLSTVSAESRMSLLASGLHIQIDDLSRPDAVAVKGTVTLVWQENAPFTFTSDDVGLKADRLSFTSSGLLQINDQTADFRQAGDLRLKFIGMQAKLQTGTAAEPAWFELNSADYAMQGQLSFDLPVSDSAATVNFDFNGPVIAIYPVITVPADEDSPPTTISADEMSINAALISYNGELMSSGSGVFINGQTQPASASAVKTELTWKELDLIKLSGNLGTRTQGFAATLEGETWTGFDVDITYSLLNANAVKGSGTIMFDSGLDMPVIFSGNTQTEYWNVTLPANRIKLSQLGSFLSVANVDMPESITFTDGYIDMQGDVQIGDEIKANMTISGNEMGASMYESNVSEASFEFSTIYGSTISARGPVAVKSVSLAGGIDVSHIRADLNFESTGTMGLTNFHGELLDGELNLAKLRFVENGIEDTTIELTHIDLSRLLAFADIDGLEGTGSLDIILPAGSDEQGVHIRNGTFSSTGPGRLAYSQQGSVAGNIGMQALENFHYQELSGTIDYQSEGDYQIKIRLNGKNPDLYGGHPISFNLNIGGLLPEFFEALFISGSFEEAILKQMRSNYAE